MQIHTVYPRGFGANTYILTADNKTAIVIDPSQPRIADELSRLGLTASYVLLTHCHFDHVGGVCTLQAQGAKVLCSAPEKPLISAPANVFSLFGAPWAPFEYTVDETLSDGEERSLCGISVKTLYTPGHTAGGACYLIVDETKKRHLFTGDTLFAGSIGRTDFPTGDMATLRASLRKLASLEDAIVYPGHEETTTLFMEKKTNPFIKDA